MQWLLQSTDNLLISEKRDICLDAHFSQSEGDNKPLHFLYSPLEELRNTREQNPTAHFTKTTFFLLFYFELN